MTQQTAIRVKEAAFVCYPVQEMARARKFYETVLHLKPETEFADESGNVWVEYELGNVTFSLGYMPEGGMQPSGNAALIALEVEDFDETIKALKAENVTFTMPPLETPVCRMCSILDPEGNGLMIHRRN